MGKRFRLGLLLLIVLAAVGFGIFGLTRDPGVTDKSLMNVGFGVLSLFFNFNFINDRQVPRSLEIAQLLGPTATGLSVLEIFRSRLMRLIRRTQLRKMRGHLVLIGLGTYSRAALAHLRYVPPLVIVVEPDPSPRGEHTLTAFNHLLLPGDGTDLSMLKRSRFWDAKEVLVATGQDSVDLAVVESMRKCIKGRVLSANPLVTVRLDSPHLARRLQRIELQQKERTLEVNYTSSATIAAANVANLLLDRTVGLAGASKFSAVAIYGDSAIAAEVELLMLRSRDIFRSLGLDSPLAGEVLVAPELGELPQNSAAVISFQDDLLSMGHASRILDAVRGATALVFVPCGPDDLVSQSLSNGSTLLAVDPEHLSARGRDATMLELMAQIVHADYSQQNPAAEYRSRWIDLPEQIRESNRLAVRGYSSILEAANLSLSDDPSTAIPVLDAAIVERLSTAEHLRWMQERLDGGWRFGAKTDRAKKIHSSLVPYEQLSEEEKEKDRQAVRRIAPIVSLVGLVITNSSSYASGYPTGP
jgi:RyR domain/TrkA-N domain